MQNWKPPENFTEVQSKLPYIRIWAPEIKRDDEKIKPTTFNCPNCGAPTKYDIAVGGIACEHCGFKAKQTSRTVGKQAVEKEFLVATIKEAKKNWIKDRDQIHCNNCGAEIIVEKTDLSTICPFCGSSKVNLQKPPLEDLQPQAILPIRIKKEDITRNINSWLGKGWFHPAELKTSSIIRKVNPIYIPVWTFDAKIIAHWRALVGHERQERYYDASSKSWKTKTVIDWRWEDGEVDCFIDDLPVIGSKHISSLLFESIKPFDLNLLAEFSPDFLAGWKAHAYTKFLPDAWIEAKNKMREYMKDVAYKDIHSSHIRNFSLSADFQDETWRYILLPIYLAAYNFNGEFFHIMANGQTGKIAGQKPVDWTKVWLVIMGILSPGSLLILFGIVLLLLGKNGLIPSLIGVFSLIIALVISLTIFRSAKKAEEGSD